MNEFSAWRTVCGWKHGACTVLVLLNGACGGTGREPGAGGSGDGTAGDEALESPVWASQQVPLPHATHGRAPETEPPTHGQGGGTGDVSTEAGSDTHRANFGTLTLRPGFSPGLRVLRGVSGGLIDARELRGHCRGWISNTPDHLLVVEDAISDLRVLVRSDQDTTLIVADDQENGTVGSVWCDDDSGTDRNPAATMDIPVGTYRVWIGSYREGANAHYSLGVTEDPSVRTEDLPSPQ